MAAPHCLVSPTMFNPFLFVTVYVLRSILKLYHASGLMALLKKLWLIEASQPFCFCIHNYDLKLKDNVYKNLSMIMVIAILYHSNIPCFYILILVQ